MITRLVDAPSAPSQTNAFGAWPSVGFHGWKWSLTNTESKPTCSATTENASSFDGANCSAEALYPSLSTMRLLLSERSYCRPQGPSTCPRGLCQLDQFTPHPARIAHRRRPGNAARAFAVRQVAAIDVNCDHLPR